MKRIFLILLIPIVFACNSNKHTENISLVEQYVKSVEDLEYETMALVLDDNYLGLGPSVGDSIRKEDALEHWKDNIENLV